MMRNTNVPIQEVFRARFLASAGAASFVVGMNPGPYNAAQLIGTSLNVEDEDDASAYTVTFASTDFANPYGNATAAEVATAIGSSTSVVTSVALDGGYTGRTYLKILASAADKDLTITKDTAAGAKDALVILGLLPVVIDASAFTATYDLSSYFIDDLGLGAEMCPPLVQVYEVSSNAWTLDVDNVVVWTDEVSATPHILSVDSGAAIDGAVVITFV